MGGEVKAWVGVKGWVARSGHGREQGNAMVMTPGAGAKRMGVGDTVNRGGMGGQREEGGGEEEQEGEASTGGSRA